MYKYSLLIGANVGPYYWYWIISKGRRGYRKSEVLIDLLIIHLFLYNKNKC